MPLPRGAALIPLLTVLGTTAAAAVLAQKYVPQYFADKHKKRRQTSYTESNLDDEFPLAPKMTTPTMMPPPKPLVKAPQAPSMATPRSSEVVAVLLQDPYLLISAFGVCIMVVAVLVSLMLVEFREDVASLNDLQMFGPLMLVAMGLISLGMVLSMANPKAAPMVETAENDVVEEKTTSPEDLAALKKAASEGDQGFIYNYYKKKYANQETEMEVVDEHGVKKRVSRCPFGFT